MIKILKQKKVWFALVVILGLFSLFTIPYISQFEGNWFYGVIIPVMGTYFCYEAIFEKECQFLLVSLDLGDKGNEFTPILRIGIFALGFIALLFPFYLFLIDPIK
jgi:putative Mn2+ efflux pump MntP